MTKTISSLGELTAHCMGPKKVAYCELYDHRDGTFTLNVKPQEPGKHTLQIKYGGDHVPGTYMHVVVLNQSINLSINQPTNQSINQSINQLTNQ